MSSNLTSAIDDNLSRIIQCFLEDWSFNNLTFTSFLVPFSHDFRVSYARDSVAKRPADIITTHLKHQLSHRDFPYPMSLPFQPHVHFAEIILSEVRTVLLECLECMIAVGRRDPAMRSFVWSFQLLALWMELYSTMIHLLFESSAL